ncbi:uncharacterized protein BYT42DRAFT_55142 [Radiomyces spectabilis]|uniref:uncharacterized protein n=1 Tax=Radiomyces spectabilis TaxID=64574 RepID=UPI00221F6ECC|nr:uncharacterized protein BYT42DRAFT_55142 [Radiomyces spectabilis]KAI8373009.1 hypothetical protein BYT42DRAFT_55142 [Radiomyces spectabilis]
MSNLNWCTACDNAISPYSESLYCSEQCLRVDALRNHPLLGYTYPEFVNFPRPYPKQSSSSSTASTTAEQPSSSLLASSCSIASSPHSSPALTATTASSMSLQPASPPNFDLSSVMRLPSDEPLSLKPLTSPSRLMNTARFNDF